jgi:hypothetical protein
MHHQDDRGGGGERDRREVLGHIEAEGGIDRRVGDVGRRSQEQGVAVIGRAGDELGGEARSGARLVLDHELLAERLPHALTEHAGGDVGCRARNEADNDAHRPRGIVLAMSCGQNKLRGERQGQRQRSSPSAIHLVSSRYRDCSACYEVIAS